MASTALFILCASAVLAQISCQCLSGLSLASPGIAAPSGCGCGASLAAPVLSTSGGILAVTSSSPLVPGGFYVSSDNTLEGHLNVCGALPHLSAVAFEGQLPSAGSASVSYGCGDNVAITSAAPARQAYGALGLGSGLGSGCGCGNALLL